MKYRAEFPQWWNVNKYIYLFKYCTKVQIWRSSRRSSLGSQVKYCCGQDQQHNTFYPTRKRSTLNSISLSVCYFEYFFSTFLWHYIFLSCTTSVFLHTGAAAVLCSRIRPSAVCGRQQIQENKNDWLWPQQWQSDVHCADKRRERGENFSGNCISSLAIWLFICRYLALCYLLVEYSSALQ